MRNCELRVLIDDILTDQDLKQVEIAQVIHFKNLAYLGFEMEEQLSSLQKELTTLKF